MDFVSLVDMDPVGYKTFSWIRNYLFRIRILTTVKTGLASMLFLYETLKVELRWGLDK